MEVWPLDGKKGDGGGTKAGDEMWPGNNLAKLEWTPKEEYQSAGIADHGPRTAEVRPDRHPRHRRERAGHGQEALRAVAVDPRHRARRRRGRHPRDGGDRHRGRRGARGRSDPAQGGSRGRADRGSEVLANTIIYFTYPNPDGWRRGSAGDTDKGPGVFFQRYNGNGIDPNRDWPDIGYTFRPYSGDSEPETRAFQTFYREVEDARRPVRGRRRPARAAVRRRALLHADAARAARPRQGLPHPRGVEADQPGAVRSDEVVAADPGQRPAAADCIPEDAQALGAACDQIYAQTWGSVYDTINYTTTGTLGDWFDSHIGLGRGRHRQRDVVLAPRPQHRLRAAGRAAARRRQQGDHLLPHRRPAAPARRGVLDAGQERLRAELPAHARGEDRTSRRCRRARARRRTSPTRPRPAVSEPGPPPSSGFEFTVERDADTFSGGMRVDVRATNVQGIGAGVATLQVQCRGCDRPRHRAPDEWVTVAEDYNQSPLYAQAGLTAAVNDPQPFKPDGSPVEWRAVVSAPGGIPSFSVDFTSGPATSDANTGGGEAPFLAAYDVANTDFFSDLNGEAVADERRVRRDRPAEGRIGRAEPVRARHARPGRQRAARLHRHVQGRGRRHRAADGRLRVRADEADDPGPGAGVVRAERREHRVQAVRDRGERRQLNPSTSGSSGLRPRPTTTSSSTPTRTATASSTPTTPR